MVAKITLPCKPGNPHGNWNFSGRSLELMLAAEAGFPAYNK
jgi:hypothetical protein